MKITPVEFADLIEKYVRAIEYNKAQITELTNKLMLIEMKAKTSPFTSELLFQLYQHLKDSNVEKALSKGNISFEPILKSVRTELINIGYSEKELY